MKYARIALYFFLVFPISSASAEVNSFVSVYREAERLLAEKNYGAFGNITETLIQLREEDGYANLSPLSERLIEAGRQSCALGESNCSFFIRVAVLLSPTDPWILFTSATQVRGFKESCSLYFSAFRNATNSPTFFFKSWVVFGIFLLTFTSLFVVLKLLFGIVRFELKKHTPKAILTYSGLSLFGLPFGLIPTGLCWSLIILLFVGRKREIFQLLLLTLLWIVFLPTAENIIRFVNRPEEREFELLLSRVSSPSSGVGSLSYLREPLYLGTKFFRDGNFEKAKEQFLLAKSANRESSLLALSRLSASELGLKQFSDAKISIANARAQGLNSYESVHNEAILAASTSNLSQSRILVDRLKEIDGNRLAKASLSGGILLEPASLGIFSDRYLEPMEMHLNRTPPPIEWILSEGVLLPLCSMGLSGLLITSLMMTCLLLIPTQKLRGFV